MQIHKPAITTWCLIYPISALMIALPWQARSQTLSRNPDNPRHLLYQGKPIVLVTATEHYGAVLNGEFQYTPYLDELAGHGLNLSRVFTFYREVEKSIKSLGFANTLAPRPTREILPWKRTGPGRALDGGLKFNLEQWHADYFARFHDFLLQSAKRGIIVEVVLFGRSYDQDIWSRNPLHPQNNVNGVGGGLSDFTQYWEIHDGTVFNAQKAFVRKIVQELNSFDNLYFEILNEGYGASEAGVARLRAWQLAICDVIRETEKRLPKKHLIAVNAHQRIE